MPLASSDLRAAERAVVAAESGFAPLVREHGPCTIGVRPRRSHFEALARAIVFQQLAGRAANAIWQRVRSLASGPFRPEAVVSLSDGDLRGAGLSATKAASIRDLATHALDGTVPLRGLARLSDHEVVDRLTVVRGIGPWTAEMFLMFQLGRLHVWPAGDYGVRKGFGLVAGIDPMPIEKEMPALGEPFAPYRSVAAWYCWRAVEGAAAAAAE